LERRNFGALQRGVTMGFLRRLFGFEPQGKFPGQSLANLELQRDTFSQLLFMDRVFDQACRKKRKVLNTEVVNEPRNLEFSPDGRMLRGQWTERWYLDRGGQVVAYDVDYSADGQGGTNLGIALHQEP
jgi:hypothetical protein